jgi:hypothetical protein
MLHGHEPPREPPPLRHKDTKNLFSAAILQLKMVPKNSKKTTNKTRVIQKLKKFSKIFL